MITFSVQVLWASELVHVHLAVLEHGELVFPKVPEAKISIDSSSDSDQASLQLSAVSPLVRGRSRRGSSKPKPRESAGVHDPPHRRGLFPGGHEHRGGGAGGRGRTLGSGGLGLGRGWGGAGGRGGFFAGLGGFAGLSWCFWFRFFWSQTLVWLGWLGWVWQVGLPERQYPQHH